MTYEDLRALNKKVYYRYGAQGADLSPCDPDVLVLCAEIDELLFRVESLEK